MLIYRGYLNRNTIVTVGRRIHVVNWQLRADKSSISCQVKRMLLRYRLKIPIL